MKKLENQCVGCPTEMGCLASACRYRNVPVYYCDICGDYATYQLKDEDYCEDCMEKYLQDLFNDLSIEEQAELLDVDLSRNDD